MGGLRVSFRFEILGFRSGYTREAMPFMGIWTMDGYIEPYGRVNSLVAWRGSS